MALLVTRWRRLMSMIWPHIDSEEPATVSELLRLPPEIIILVASMLPTQSAASLAICCRQLSDILGPTSWKSLRRASHDVRFEFLSSLAEDLPHLFPCRKCLRLHRISAIKWPREISDSPGPPCTSGGSGNRYNHLFHSYYKIDYPQIQLAMRQHRCSIDIGFPLEAFQHLEVRQEESPQKVVLSSANAQIVPHGFLVRFQTWILVPWNRSDTFVEELANDNYVYNICVHDRLARPQNESTITDLMISRIRLLEAGENYHARTFHCPFCYLDYMVDAKDFGERGFAVITTKWVNFGACRETPDYKWRSHGDRYVDRLGITQITDRPRGVRVDFEAQQELSLEDLTADNERKLFSTRKRRRVTRAPDGYVWRWDGEKRWYLDPPKSNPSIWERWLW